MTRRHLISLALPGFARIGRTQFRSKRLLARAGAFVLTGSSAAMRVGSAYVLSAGAGAFALTGTSAALKRALRVAAAAGAFVLTGTDATLVKRKFLAADAGSFALTGTTASLVRALRLSAGAGSFAFTGAAATLRRAFNISAGAGSFSLTGTAATLRTAKRVAAAAGAFTFTGAAASVLVARRLAAAAGSYTLTGTNATLTLTTGSSFPGIASTGTTSQASSSSWTANLPASIASGNLLLMIGQANGSTTLTVPTGWSSAFNPGDGTFVFYKYASGSEGASVSISGSASRSAGIVCYRITGTDGTTAPNVQNAAVSASTTYDPPSETPAWGSLKTLWFACAMIRANSTVSTAPTSYSLQNSQISGGSNAYAHVYTRNNQVATEDPSAYTLGTSGNGYALTIGVRPA